MHDLVNDVILEAEDLDLEAETTSDQDDVDFERERIALMRDYKDDQENGQNRLPDDENNNLAVYTGDTSYVTKTRGWKSDPKINMHKATIELELSIEADQATKVNVTGRNGPDSELLAGVYQAYLRWVWHTSYLQEKIIAVRRGAMIWGTSGLMGTWREGKNGKPGRTDVRVLDPRAFMCDPDSTTNEELHESGSFSLYRFMTLDEILLAWPEDYKGRSMRKRMEKIQPESSKTDAINRELSNSGGIQDIRVGNPEREVPERYLVMELWYRDPEAETIPIMVPKPVYEMDELTGTPVIDPVTLQPIVREVRMEKIGEKEVPKYPTGRLSIAVLSETGTDILIVDEPIRYKRIPAVVFQEGRDPTRLFGISIIKNTRFLVQEINRLAGAVLDFIKQCGRPKMKTNILLAPKAELFTNSDGEIIPCRGSIHEAAEYMIPPSLPSEFWRAWERLQQAYDALTGHFDVVKGQKPPNVSAAAAIESLQSTALLRPRETIRATNRALEVFSEIMLENLQTFGANDTLWLTVTGDDGRRLFRKIEQYRQEEIAKQQQQNPAFVPSPEFGLPPFVGAVHEYADPINSAVLGYHMKVIGRHLSAADVEVRIEAGIPITESKLGRAEQAMVLWGMAPDDKGRKAIPKSALYEAIDLPDRDAILQEERAQDDLMGAMQQLQVQYQQAVAALQAAGIEMPGTQAPQPQAQGAAA